MAHLFARELLEGWIFPCSLDDIREQLESVPASDLEGLWAIGLVPSTRKNSSAHGRYLPGDKPVIHLHSFRDTFEYRLPSWVRVSRLISGLEVEQSYGMQLIEGGSRLVCKWAPEDLRRFVVEHVLLHEIGHHVFHTQRRAHGLRDCPGNHVCEQFAEAYALRMRTAPQPSTDG